MQVLAQFIRSELAACRNVIAREERRVNFWRKVTLVGCGILGTYVGLRINRFGKESS